jgi:hypothetical protein
MCQFYSDSSRFFFATNCTIADMKFWAFCHSTDIKIITRIERGETLKDRKECGEGLLVFGLW